MRKSQIANLNATPITNHKSPIANSSRPRGAQRQTLLRAMFAEWRKIASNLDLPDARTDDEARHIWIRQVLGDRGQVSGYSWSKLTVGEMRRLIKLMREESGSAPNYRAILICRLAQELFGAPWDRMLSERLYMRFQIRDSKDLTPKDAHAEIEELMSRIARRDGLHIEQVRAKFKR